MKKIISSLKMMNKLLQQYNVRPRAKDKVYILDNFFTTIFTPFNKDFFRFRHFLFGWMLTKRVTSFWMRFKVPLCQEQFNMQSKHRRPHRQQCCTMSPDCQDIRILRNDSVLCYQSHRIHSRLRNKQAIKGILVDRRESFHIINL